MTDTNGRAATAATDAGTSAASPRSEKGRERSERREKDRDHDRDSRSSRHHKDTTEERKESAAVDGGEGKDERDEGRSRSSRHRDGDGRDSRSRRSSSRHSRTHSRSRGRSPRSRSRSRSRGRSSRRRYSRSRSRSDSRPRSRHSRRRSRSYSSSSRSRSRSRERRRKQRLFDKTAVSSVLNTLAPTPGAAALPGVGVGAVGAGMDMNAALAAQMSAQYPQLTRQARRLYVGNLPTGQTTESGLTDFFNKTVIALGITTPQPVLSVWLSTESTFAFIEFRSVQDTTFALSLLQGIQIGGRTLRVGRPADYKPVPEHLANYVVGFPPGTPAPLPSFANNASFMQMLMAGQSPLQNPAMLLLLANPNAAMTTPTNGTAAATAAPQTDAAAPAGSPTAIPTSASPPAASAPTTPPAQQAPTPVLLLENMVNISELDDEDEFNDLLLDVEEEAEKSGKVLAVTIPRPINLDDAADPSTQQADSSSGPRVPPDQGVGRIFVHFADAESAAKARELMHGRSFNGRRVVASFFEPEKLVNKQFV